MLTSIAIRMTRASWPDRNIGRNGSTPFDLPKRGTRRRNENTKIITFEISNSARAGTNQAFTKNGSRQKLLNFRIIEPTILMPIWIWCLFSDCKLPSAIRLQARRALLVGSRVHSPGVSSAVETKPYRAPCLLTSAEGLAQLEGMARIGDFLPNGGPSPKQISL